MSRLSINRMRKDPTCTSPPASPLPGNHHSTSLSATLLMPRATFGSLPSFASRFARSFAMQGWHSKRKKIPRTAGNFPVFPFWKTLVLPLVCLPPRHTVSLESLFSSEHPHETNLTRLTWKSSRVWRTPHLLIRRFSGARHQFLST